MEASNHRRMEVMAAPRKYPDELRERAIRFAVCTAPVVSADRPVASVAQSGSPAWAAATFAQFSAQAGGRPIEGVVRQGRGRRELHVERRRFSWSHSVRDVLHTREAATSRPSGRVARSKPWWMSSAGLWPAALVQWTSRPGATVTSAEHAFLLTRCPSALFTIGVTAL